MPEHISNQFDNKESDRSLEDMNINLSANNTEQWRTNVLSVQISVQMAMEVTILGK